MEKFQITTVITDMKGGNKKSMGELENGFIFAGEGGNFNTGGI